MPALPIEPADPELAEPFRLVMPKGAAAPIVFCSPHSGNVYPRRFLDAARLDPHALRKSEDCLVDELFAGAVAHGAPLLAARFPRAYVDANREPFELDPELFSERPPAFANTQSVRVVGGLGTIPRIVADGEEIYARRMTMTTGLARIDQLYKPFHAALAQMLEQTHRRYGFAVLVDCHSMPSSTVGQPAQHRAHFVLGDRFGTSCDQRLTRMVRDTLAAQGYDVSLNRPYAGGFITEHYGRPANQVHAIQIEINRALYLNETTLEPTTGFAALRRALDHLAGKLVAQMAEFAPRRAAAE